MKRKAGLVLGAVLFAPVAGALAAESPQNYPARPIRIVVPQSPGGTTDLTARLIAPQLADRLGQSVVVDNRPGAGSLVGTELVAKATPDGYTLLIIASSFSINPSMYSKLPFDPVRDFAPVTLLSWYPNVLVVHPSVPANSVRELIALAKAKPGTLNYASGGTGTGTHLSAELFKTTAGISAVHVAYKGGGPANNAVVAGEVQYMFATIASVLPIVKAGRLRALAVTSARRSPAAPDLPSMAEAGLAGYDERTWNGLLAPARTPPAIVNKLSAEVAALLKSPETRERLAAQGAEPGGNRPAEFAAIIKSEIAKWARVVREAGIKHD